LYPKINLQRANLLASNIGNWVRPSAADEEYLKFKPPYRAPHLLMSDISELNLISGITPEIYTALKPYLIALPNTSNRLNILNIPKALAFALSDSITPEQAQGLLDCQTRAKQTNNAEANMESCFANLRINVDPTITIVTRSDFFLLSGEVLFTNRAIKFMSLLTQGIVNGKMQIKELWQTKIYP
jgi:general secretion pathway protein K